MNERKSQGYQSVGAEYVADQNNSLILQLVSPLDFCTVWKILRYCSLIMRFPNDHKRYSSHLEELILPQVAPIKVYLTIYENLKNSYFKKVFVS